MELNRAARLTLSTLRMPGWTRMLLLMAGTKLASVTRIEYISGSRLGKAKLPFSSVNIFWERPSCRLNSMTSAPICGTPSPLVTEPAMAPDSLTDTAPETGLAAARHTNPKTTLDTEMCVLVVIVRRYLAYHLAYPAVGISRRNRLPHQLRYRKLGTGCQGLVPVPVRDLQLQRVLPRLQFRQREQLFHGYLRGGSARQAGNVFGKLEDLFVAAVLHHLVFDLPAGFLSLLVRPEIVQFKEDAHLLVALEALRHARPHLAGADHELAHPNAARGDLFDQVGQHDGAGHQFFAVHMRHVQGSLVIVHVAAHDVLHYHIQAVRARRQRNRFLVNRGTLGVGLQHLGGAVHGDCILESLHDAPGHGGDASKHVDRRLLYSVLGLELHVFVFELQRDVGENGSFRQREEIGAHLHRQDIEGDLAGDRFFQILEFDGRRLLQFRELLQTVELHHAFRRAAERLAQVRAVGILEALRFGGHPHLFHQGEAGAGDIGQGVLFRRVHGHVVLARHGGVHELDDDVCADAFQVAVAPLLERVGGRFTAALFHGPLVGAAGGVRLDFVGRPVNDVNASAIRLPAGDSRSVMVVGVSDAPVVLFLELVLFGVRSGVAPQPELLDELFALFVRGEAMEGGLLLIGDDVDDVFVQPFLVWGFQLFAQFFVALALLFVGQRLGDGFTRRSGIRLLLIVFWSRCLILANRIPGQHQTERNTGPQTAL